MELLLIAQCMGKVCGTRVDTIRAASEPEVRVGEYGAVNSEFVNSDTFILI